MKEINQYATAQEVETTLLTWLSSIVSHNRNLIIVDKNIFSKKASTEATQRMIDLFSQLKIQNISLSTQEYDEKIIEQVQKQTKINIEVLQEDNLTEVSTWISLGGRGFWISQPIQALFNGSAASIDYLKMSELVEVLENIKS